MSYNNQYHKESEERKMKKVEEWSKNPRPSKEASKMQFEMHKRLEKLYPSGNLTADETTNLQNNEQTRLEGNETDALSRGTEQDGIGSQQDYAESNMRRN